MQFEPVHIVFVAHWHLFIVEFQYCYGGQIVVHEIPFQVVLKGHMHYFVEGFKILPPLHTTQLWPFQIILLGHIHMRELDYQILPPKQGAQLKPFHSKFVEQRQLALIHNFPPLHLLMQWVPFHISVYEHLIQVYPLKTVVAGHSLIHFPR